MIKTKFMNKILKRMSRKVAQPPGTLIHVGEKKTETVTLDLIRYNKETLEEKEMPDPCECLKEKDFKGVCWTNITGLHDIEIIKKIGSAFNLHSLELEDILNTMHRAKLEESGNHIFVVLKMLDYDRTDKEIKSEQVSFVLDSRSLVTFQEREGDVFNPVRERIRNSKGRIRKAGADYLFYALIDAVVDHYFVMLENLGEEIENLEDELLENPGPKTLQTLHRLKREMIFLRKTIWPLREIINTLVKAESKLIKKTTGIFLKDVYDHTIQVIETIETYRDMVSGLQDLYLSGVSNKMNEVMKVLTIIATIFIPLTFIAGIYGMNFEFMPELKWRFGYFYVWGLIVLLGVGMFIYFKRKKWL